MVHVLESQSKQKPQPLRKQKLKFEVDRGPDWLFVRLPDPRVPDPSMGGNGRSETGELRGEAGYHVDNLADQLWTLLNQHFVYRLVLEMDGIRLLSSSLMGQLVVLQKRTLQHGGALRLCGLSPSCQQALHLCRLDRVMPNFRNREDAVNGCVQSKPR